MVNITDTERAVMRIIWTKRKATGREIIESAQASHDWSASTIKTLVRRLTDKGVLAVDQSQKVFTYVPRISEEVAADDGAERLFDSVCDAYKGPLLTELVKTQPLSQQDIANLQDILNQRKADAPEQVACHCLAMDGEESCGPSGHHH